MRLLANLRELLPVAAIVRRQLLAKCSDNLASLQAMKHSPYYKVFEEDASMWELINE